MDFNSIFVELIRPQNDSEENIFYHTIYFFFPISQEFRYWFMESSIDLQNVTISSGTRAIEKRVHIVDERF